MADREHGTRSGPTPARKLYRVVTRIDVLSAVYILLLCAAFVLETRGHRNLFYVLGLPVFLVNLYALDAGRLWDSRLVRLAAVYAGYFLAAGFFGEGFDWDEMADLLRVTALLAVFFAITVLLAAREPGLERRLSFWLALTAAATLLVLFAGAASGLNTQGWRFTAFGLASQPVIGATLYGFVALLSAFVLLPRAASWPERLLWLGVIAICVLFMLLTSSRGPLLALTLALALGLLTADRRIALAVLALTAAAALAAVLTDQRPITLLYERAQSGHFELWQQALAAIAERPWFGYGSLTDITFTGKQGPQRSPHNLVLANQIYGGLPATLLFTALIGYALWLALGRLRRGQAIYLMLLAYGFGASLFDSRSLLQNLGREWITLWLPIALLAAGELRGGKTAESSSPPS
ncbi:O-antigen ligase family protein [Pelagibius marinus]|uniref:O-antigen ligase family protein n=1 Tax=Pelagibius marinus TaxID=2762760 RepID=UPI0018722A30|nr:O-antigen ligase family protein [Pelagibius marinus]